MKASDVWPAVIDINDLLLVEQPLLHACSHTHAHANLHTSTHAPKIDTQERTHMHVNRACLRAQGNAPAISGPLANDSTPQQIPSICLLVDSKQKMKHRQDHNETIFRLG